MATPAIFGRRLLFVGWWCDAVEEVFGGVREVLGDASIVVDAVAVGVAFDEGVVHGEFEMLVEAANPFIVAITTGKEFEFRIRDVR